eukprot:g11381.t1
MEVEVQLQMQRDAAARNDSLAPPLRSRQQHSVSDPRNSHDLVKRVGKRNPCKWRPKPRQRQHHHQHSWQRRPKEGVGGEAGGVDEKAGRDKRRRRSFGQFAGDHDRATVEARTGEAAAAAPAPGGGGGGGGGGRGGGEGVTTIEKIMHICGQSLIKPSVVSAPMDFLTTEAEYVRVWQVFKNWLCSAVSAKLRACIPKFFSLSYRVFNLGICIPTLELDTRFLERYGISQEQSLSSKSSLSPRAPQQVEFSREALGKAAGLPPARAFYALEVMLCAVGKEAGLGTTLLVDCGVGVLAARGRVVKFTFVQGTDSLEVVHREPTPGHNPSHTAAAGNVSSSSSPAKRGGIHAFGQSYIPYTSRANKELTLARSRETAALLRSLRQARADQFLPPQGVEGEESMATDDGVVETMRAWKPGVATPTTSVGSAAAVATAAMAAAGVAGHTSPPAAAACGNNNDDNAVFKSDHDVTAKASETANAGGRAKARVGRMASPLRARRHRERGAVARTTTATTATDGVSAPPALDPPPPPLMDVHARLRGSILSPSPSLTPATCFLGPSSPVEGGGVMSCPPMGFEPAGVERLGSHYSPAAQALYLDIGRGRLAWRDGADGAGCLRPGSVEVNRGGGGPAGVVLDGSDAPWAQHKRAAVSARSSRVWSGLDSRVTSCGGGGGGQYAEEKSAAGELHAATAVPQAPANLPPVCGIDTPKDRTAGTGSSPSLPLSPSSPTAEKLSDTRLPQEATHSNPVAPDDPRGSGTTPRQTNPGYRLTHAPGEITTSARRAKDVVAVEGGRSGLVGAARTHDVVPNRSGSGEHDGGGGRGHGAAAVFQVARAVKNSETDERHRAGFTRYHYYLQRDTTFAESVTDLQPPWQAGIVRKVLDGLHRPGGGGGGDDDGYSLSSNGYHGRRAGTPESSCSGDSGPEDAGGAAGRRAGSGATAAAAEGCSAGGEGADPDDEEEGEDKFEVSAGLGSPRLAGSMATRVGQRLEPARTGGGGGGRGGSAPVATDGEKVAPPAASTATATPTMKAAIVAPRRQEEGDTVKAGARARGAAAAGMPNIPERFRASLESRLGETCDAFQTSIRRAVLNYVLLDEGQRDRLGIPVVPPGFESEGWGWGKGRAVPESPPEWHRRFLRARDAMGGGGQIAGSPVMVAAQELLVRCRETRLLRLPRSADEIRGSSWSPMTAQEFRSSQLRYLRRRVGRIRRLLFPGLSEALTTNLGQIWAGTGGGSATAPPQPPDGHVRRYLLAVNVMTASVLRGVVERALSDLLDFFRIHATPSVNLNGEGGYNDTRSPWSRRSGGGGGSGTGDGGGGGVGDAGGDRETRRERGGLDNATAGWEQAQEEERPLQGCPPLFKVFLEDSFVSHRTPWRSRKLSCRQSLRDLRSAVMDVVRGVVLCFADLPRVTYGCSSDEGVRSNAAGEGAIDEAAKSAGPSDAGTDAIDLHDLHDRKPSAATGKGSRRYGLAAAASDSDDSSTVSSLKDLPRFATRGSVVNGGGRGGGGDDGDIQRHPMSGDDADPPRLSVLSPAEPLVKDTVRLVQSFLRAGSSPAKAACRVYQPFAALLEEEAAVAVSNRGMAEATVSEKDLPTLATALERYKSTAAVLRAGGDAAPVELPSKMVVVDCEEASRKLLQVAGDLRRGVLQRVESTLGKLTSGVTKQARTAILRLGKRPRSTEDMMEAIECLRTTRAEEQVRLQQQQVWMGQLLDFIFKYGGLQPDIVVAVAGVHRVMVELATATEKAGKAIAEGKAQLQKNIEKAKRRLESDVESTQMRIAGFVESDGRPRDMSEKAAAFSKELDGLKAQAVSICEEEAKIDGYTTGVLSAMAEKAIASFQPYADVWSLVGAVGPFITTTARTAVTTLDPETISAEHTSMKTRLEELQKIMTQRSHAVPARATQESLRLLSTLEKDIPVMRALTNANLKDRHWWQVSALVGVTVSWEHPTTLQQLNELDVLTDAKVEAILRLSDDANAEHELEVSTAEVDRFVNEEAVVRIRSGGDGGDAEEGPGGGAEGEGIQQIEGAAGIVSRLDEDHLRKVLEQAEHCRQIVSEAKETDAAKTVAAAAARSAATVAASTAEDDRHGAGSPPGIIETLETALSNLIRVGEAMLKCADLVVELESELDELTADEADHEELLKDAIRRWQALLSASIGQSLKDLVEVIEEELVHLEEVSEA